MRVFLIFSLIAFSCAANLKEPKLVPRFNVVQERTSNGAPSVSIAFPDGHYDKLVLDKFYGNEEDRMANKERCHYFGHLENEPEACVAMTGCIGSEDVELTILSTHSKEAHVFRWNKKGNVEILDRFENDLHGNDEAVDVVRVSDDGDVSDDDDKNDEIILPKLEAAFLAAEQNCAGGSCSLPATQHLQIRVGYTDGLLYKVGGTKSQAVSYIAATWVHVQAYYCHHTLGSKVLVERLPGIIHYPGVDLSDRKLQKMYENTENDLGNADLMLYFGYNPGCDNCAWGGGKAYKGVVCESGIDKYKQSINLYGTSHALLAESVAHEIGHNLGMEHDFSTVHGGTGKADTSNNPCNGQGFMSYGSHPSKWTSCSVNDFTAQYELEKDNWCMPAAPSACGGSSGPITTPGSGCQFGNGGWGCCSSSNQCGVGEGDCDNDDECLGNLKCGEGNGFDDNCDTSLGFGSKYDCCYDPESAAGSGCHDGNGGWECCSSSNQCGEGEGDCDNDSECSGNLKCGQGSGYDDNCDTSLGFGSTYDCCYDPEKPIGPGTATGCQNGKDGGWDCCSTSNPCGEGEGDCDNNDECFGNLHCGQGGGFDDNCDTSLGFDSGHDCCFDPEKPRN